MGLATLQSSGCVAILPLRAVYTIVMLSESIPSDHKGVPNVFFFKAVLCQHVARALLLMVEKNVKAK